VPPLQATTADQAAHQAPQGAAEATVACPICLEDVAPSWTLTLSACAHAFCQPCLRGYLAARVADRAPLPVACPLPDCRRPLAQGEIVPFLTGEELDTLATVGAFFASPHRRSSSDVHAPPTNRPPHAAGLPARGLPARGVHASAARS
jgi:hypothetical protein